MVAFSAEIEVAAPPETAWKIMSDITREPQWMRATKNVSFLHGAAGYFQGARMKRSGGFMGLKLEWESEITACDFNRVIAFRHSGAIQGDSRWEISPAPGGCRIRFSSDGPAPGPLRWFPALAAMGGRAGLKRDLKYLKALIEGK